MSPDERTPEQRGRGLDLALTGACVVAGWVLHDLIVFLVSGLPSVAWKIVPGSLVAVLLGALFGLIASKGTVRVLAVALALAAVASLVPRFASTPFSVAHSWLPRAVFLLLVAFALARVTTALVKSMGTVRAGLAFGALASLTMAAARVDLWGPNWTTLWSALIVLAAGLAPWSKVRWAATLVAVAWAAFWTVDRVRATSELQRADLGPPPVAAAAGAPNLVLIVLDTVRATHLAPYGYERVTTPALDAFAREHCTIYTNARSTTSWTLPSHASLFTGLYPAQHGATHPRVDDPDNTHRVAIRPARPLKDGAITIAKYLREKKGYRTAAVLANNAYLNPIFGLDRGYEHYDARRGSMVRRYLALSQLSGRGLRWGATVYRDGDTITDLALDWLDGRDGSEPFFLTLNYMDAHAPYLPPPPYDRAFGDAQPLDALDPEIELWPLLYDRSLRFLDAQLERVFDRLREDGLLENTVVIVTSDHGEAFGEHDWWTHAWILYDEVLHVPLYVKPVGAREAELDERVISGADIFALTRYLMGFADEPPPDATSVVGEWYAGESNPGIDATAERTGRNVESDLLAWIEDGRVKYIVGSNDEVEAYDLALDPGEQAPLELTEAEKEAARARARTWWADHPPPEGGELVFSEEELEAMKALGYMGGEDDEDD